LRVAAYWLRAGCEAARSLKREAKGIARYVVRPRAVSRTSGLPVRAQVHDVKNTTATPGKRAVVHISAFEVDANLHTAYTLREHFCACCRYMYNPDYRSVTRGRPFIKS
jgi:hypothetical protein